MRYEPHSWRTKGATQRAPHAPTAAHRVQWKSASNASKDNNAKKCCRYLPDHLFVTHTVCRACNKKQNKPRPTIKNALNETATEIEILSTPHFMDYPSLITRYTQSITEHVDEYVQRHGSILLGVVPRAVRSVVVEGRFGAEGV